ncbi:MULTISPECIES: ATP-binding protein [Streptomyces]|uniref:Non-specific serine/threonine protein kinase n=1 Tax=Streptomyces stelliscabiei TaxID=146820 RepID=A0A8I0TNC7_9ACTN|nr:MULTISPECIES: LuxR C-terminal-related transcriptional regulator [Streptomyces]MBE1594082.1 non-specific serine/threonine protein kinase [Streptomyces stelliscabiei]MDX2520351.1 LuxR C-terminal-related transcriptional regulator [Streptomyces stelliscabiei]MDX3274873.1 LuxR C-terminal-related transcriptional regulator [Streptomyces scabiei]
MARLQRGNLPAEVTSFVGRRAELPTLKKTLERFRAVTVTGTGGVGKTRLARRVAAEVSGSFADGAWLIELDDLADGALLPSTVLLGLGLRDDGGAPLEARLADHFRAKQALLLLDGCDGVVDACARLVASLLRAAPGLKVLSTSRRPFHVEGEAVVAVGPLPVPPADEPEAEAVALMGYDAVALFVERAAAVRADVVDSDARLATIARICRRLDGLPMAIEFAADRLDVLALDELDGRLHDAYRVLVSAKRGAPQRQRTLQALVESSYALCSSEEQLLWERLTVFTGRFGLPAVEHVCTDEVISDERVLDLVAGLIDKSVLVREERTGGSWYRLPRLLREYALQRVTGAGEPGEWDRLRGRHVQWCLWLASQASDGLLTERSQDWIGQVRGNHANIRAALDYCFEDKQRAQDGFRLAAALWYHWVMTGLVAEGRAWLERGLGIAPSEPTPGRALALTVAAYLAVMSGDSADDLLAASNATAAELADPSVTGNLRFVEGLLAIHQRDLATACAKLDLALDAFRVSGSRMSTGKTLCLLGMAWTLNGDWERGRGYCEEFLAMPAASSENWGFGYIQWTTALAEWQHGSFLSARLAQKHSAQLACRFDDRFGMGSCVQSAALYFASTGRHKEAALLMGAAETHRFPAFTVLDELRRGCVDDVRDALGGAAFVELIEEGRALTLVQAAEVVAGGRRMPAGAPVSAPDVPEALSKREWEVAQLVAGGQGNKHIAAALVISTRTAEGHVQRILGKLGFTSRAQIAAWVTEQRALARAEARVGHGG